MNLLNTLRLVDYHQSQRNRGRPHCEEILLRERADHDCLFTLASTSDSYFVRAEGVERVHVKRSTQRAIFGLLSHQSQPSGQKYSGMRASMGTRLGPRRLVVRQNVDVFNSWDETAVEFMGALDAGNGKLPIYSLLKLKCHRCNRRTKLKGLHPDQVTSERRQKPAKVIHSDVHPPPSNSRNPLNSWQAADPAPSPA